MCANDVKTIGSNAGASLLELLAVIVLLGVLSFFAVQELVSYQEPLESGSNALASYFRQVRARALATTSAYTVVPLSASELASSYGTGCSSTGSRTDDGRLRFSLPQGVSLTSASWSICFNSRGLPDVNLAVGLKDEKGARRSVEILLGGAVEES